MFNQKYAPTKFADLVFQNDISRKRLEAYANGTRCGNILLHGPYGTAKSTTAEIIAEQSRQQTEYGFDLDIDVIDCATFNDKTLDLIQRGWSISSSKFPYAVLDEFDVLTKSQQFKVRAFMAKTNAFGGLILTTNHLHAIDGAIQSRCDLVELPSLQSQTLLKQAQRVLVAENVVLEDAEVLKAIKLCKGDMRKMLRQLEAIVEASSRMSAA